MEFFQSDDRNFWIQSWYRTSWLWLLLWIRWCRYTSRWYRSVSLWLCLQMRLSLFQCYISSESELINCHFGIQKCIQRMFYIFMSIGNLDGNSSTSITFLTCMFSKETKYPYSLRFKYYPIAILITWKWVMIIFKKGNCTFVTK